VNSYCIKVKWDTGIKCQYYKSKLWWWTHHFRLRETF